MRTSQILTCFVTLVCAISQVSAHPGHGDTVESDSVLHYVSSPVHFVPIIAGIAGVAATGLTVVIRRRIVAARRLQKEASLRQRS